MGDLEENATNKEFSSVVQRSNSPKQNRKSWTPSSKRYSTSSNSHAGLSHSYHGTTPESFRLTNGTLNTSVTQSNSPKKIHLSPSKSRVLNSRNTSPSPTRYTVGSTNTTLLRKSRDNTPTSIMPTVDKTQSRLSYSDSPNNTLLSRISRQSPNRSCKVSRDVENSPTRLSMRHSSPSPTRKSRLATNSSPRPSRALFSRNVEALHSGTPTNQQLSSSSRNYQLNKSYSLHDADAASTRRSEYSIRNLNNSNSVVNGIPSSMSTSAYSSRDATKVTSSPVSRKTPSHSPPMFQPAPKKSNTVSDFFSKSCDKNMRLNKNFTDKKLSLNSETNENINIGVTGRVSGDNCSIKSYSNYSLSNSPSNVRSYTAVYNHNSGNKTVANYNNTGVNSKYISSNQRTNSSPGKVFSNGDCKRERERGVAVSKPTPNPRPAHLNITNDCLRQKHSSAAFSCPPVTSCFAVFSSVSLTSPDAATHGSFSSQTDSTLPAKFVHSSSSSSGNSSCSEIPKLWSPHNERSTAIVTESSDRLISNSSPLNSSFSVTSSRLPFSLNLRDKENDRNAINSPTDSTKETSWSTSNATTVVSENNSKMVMTVASVDSMNSDPSSDSEINTPGGSSDHMDVDSRYDHYNYTSNDAARNHVIYCDSKNQNSTDC